MFMLKEGDKAPDFTVLDTSAQEVSLKNFKGKDVVLFFFPKANAPGAGMNTLHSNSWGIHPSPGTERER
jgi:peroxiredoxin